MKKKNPKLGKCFEHAAQYMLKAKDKDMFLVHGHATGTGVQNKGIKFLHAWIEDGDMVIDPSRSKNDPSITRREKYYQVGNIVAGESMRYTIDEVVDKILKHKTYGPWDLEATKQELALTGSL